MTAIEDLAVCLDVAMDVDIELDRRVLTVRQILALDVGSVIRMNRAAGENLDIRVGGALFGFGEIVANEASTGVRLTDFFQNE